ncbi:C25 family cysteine peptidase [Hymenobacter aerilatus]|uniref:C25 family cysteine peptidase n=1 Tax=Hymenobacter aerilatus TaxID=2932251 RepID=A0A8T9SW49_9BACT|nr:C25 family cysteine peptidase [Hymenobacter aerilatus]UOR06288.1 C25 family cysteine peptidase [Hymenobacter aerilatus]
MNYTYNWAVRGLWQRLLAVVMLMLGGYPVLAQSGPYGNEWIVPGQQYYKVQTVRDGLYRLDNAYLTQAGINGVNPSQFQLWRRGQQVAIYVGGNATTQDASTYIEFFGQGNDAKLDRGMYKRAQDQAQPYHSLYTDTAAYFLTWSSASQTKRMAQPVATAPGTAAPYWLRPELQVHGYLYADVDETAYLFQPWAEPGEGFFSGAMNTNGFTFPIGTEQRQNMAAGARLETRLVGSSKANHIVEVAIEQPSGTRRLLGAERFDNYASRKVSYALQPADVRPDGTIRVQIKPSNTAEGQRDIARISYFKVTYPQTARWIATRESRHFQSDSTLNAPAYYVLDSIPASVYGYDVTDPYAVQRITGTAATGAKRGFYFPSASASSSRRLLLADTEKPLVPVLPARRVNFLALQPTMANYIIVTSPVQMRPAGGVANPAQAYADYRASAAGGKFDVLMVTSQQLYDQFHYGEKSALALRQFALWMLTDKSREKFLLLLGKGYHVGEGFNGTYPRNMPGVEQVPTSTRSASDIFFTADWPNNNYTAGMATGRISASTPQQVVNYLNKLKEHEALGLEPWRKRAINLAGGANLTDYAEFNGYIDKYKQLIEAPCFGGEVVKTYRRSALGSVGSFPVGINISEELNKGLSMITYFGHGSTTTLDLDIGSVNDATKNYNNKGKYPVMFVNGCAAGNTFTPYATLCEDWVFTPDKGFVGFMCESGFGFSNDLNESQTLMYKLLLNDPAWYGKPVARVWNEVARRLQPIAQYSPSTASNLMCTIWQGDPALRLFSPAKPDLVVTNDSLHIPAAANGQPVLASAESFKLVINAGNLGSLCGAEKVDVCVTRKYPATSGRRDDAYSFSFTATQRDNTYTVDIPNTGDVFGENTFIVKLDCNNLIDELDETNNEAQLKYNFLRGGVTALTPTEFAIVPSGTVRLVGQSNLISTEPRLFDMELDTVPTFNSPLVQRNNTVSGRQLASWSATVPTVAGRDSVVWYWRLRLQTPQAEESNAWATSSFRVIPGSAGGWSQSHYGQLQRNTQQRVVVAAPNGRWSFTEADGGSGVVTSTLIGPAQQWTTLFHTVRTQENDSYTLRLLGVDATGATTVLNPNVTSRTYSLADVSATRYPYLQLQVVLRDTLSRTAPQLRQLLVTYQGVPEGVVRPDLATTDAYAAATLTRQAASGTLSFPVYFQNISTTDFGTPLKAEVTLRDAANRTSTTLVEYKGGVLKAGETAKIDVTANVVNLATGVVTGSVNVNPRLLPEQYYFNNQLVLPNFNVNNSSTPPTLDVAFDGQHILNGDIVSPSPLVTVQLQNNNLLRPVKEASNFSLFLVKPGESNATEVNMNSSAVAFMADSAKGMARIEYRPITALADGKYTLIAQGRDASGSTAGSQEYRVTFEVINESTITNVYPYPNPMTSKAKFVFTLTGAQVPRNMKIQILSLTGRVVREIMMAELGPLRIGNNISDYAWDGTDEFGDRLANGTYLYRVVLDDPNKDFQHRTTAGDKAFKKDWGKIVLLR